MKPIRLITICLVWMVFAALSHGVERKSAHKALLKAQKKSATRMPPAPPGAVPTRRAEVHTKGAHRAMRAAPIPIAPRQLRITWVWLDGDGKILQNPGRETVVVIEAQRMSEVGKWELVGYVTNGNAFVTQVGTPSRQFRVGLLP